MSDDDVSYHSGQTVMVRYSDGKLYAAEVVKEVPTGYKIVWLEDNSTAKVPKSSIQPIPVDLHTDHRFVIGTRIISEDDEVWYSGSIAGMFDFGYYVDWDNSADRSRVLESKAVPFPPSGALRVGARVLALYEAGEWYDASLKSLFSDGVEVSWADGSGVVRLGSTDVIPFPEEMAARLPVEQSDSTSAALKSSAELKSFSVYLKNRMTGGDVSATGIAEEQYCPHCRRTHSVKWFRDGANGIRWFFCNQVEPPAIAFVPLDGGPLTSAPVGDFLVKYPAIPREEPSFLKLLFASSRVQISPLPPFVTLTLGEKADRS